MNQTPTSPHGTRIVWLDATKGLGILLVMIGHAQAIGTMAPYVRDWVCSAYMPLFFLCSGYVMHAEAPTLGALTRRCSRLLIPYVCYGLVSTAADTMLSGHGFRWTGWAGLLYSRFCLYPSGTPGNVFFLTAFNVRPLWFLTAMTTATLVYAAVQHGWPRCSVMARVSLIALSFAVSAAATRLPILLPWSLDMACFFALCLAAGQWLRRLFVDGRWRRHEWAIGLAALTAYSLAVALNGYVNLSVRIYGARDLWSIPLVSLASLCFFVAVRWLLIAPGACLTRPLAYVGRLSLRLMCIHVAFISMGDHLLPDAICPWGTTAIETGASIAAAALIGSAIGRWKGRCPLLGYL